MVDNLKITFQLTQKDVYRSNVSIVTESLKKRSVIIGLFFIELLAIAGAVGFLFTPRTDGSNLSTIAACIAVVFVFPGILLSVCYLNPYFAAKSLYKNNANVRGFVHWSFSEERITQQMATGNAELLWSTFIKARETNELFLFYPQKYLAYPIPKRAFADEKEISALRELIQRHIKDVRK